MIILPHRETNGRLTFKIIYWGTNNSGKVEIVNWLVDKEGMAKGKLHRRGDTSGEILFFELKPSEITRIRIQVYTNTRHKVNKFQDEEILKGADGIFFVWDAQKAQTVENLCSLDELISSLGDRLSSEVTLFIIITKAELSDTVDQESVEGNLKERGLDRYLNPILKYDDINMPEFIFEVNLNTGFNIKRSFGHLSREVIVKHYQVKK